MADNKVSRTIPCNHRVKEYNVFNLQRIAAMTIGEVYDSVSQSGGIVTKKCAVCKDLLESLIRQVPMCKPSEPMSADDQSKTAVFIQRWLSHLNSKLDEVSKPVKPVYLRDAVTEILHQKGHDIKCENAMISWYLGQYKTKVLDPEKIAQAIIDHEGTEWSKMKPLVKDTEYNIRLNVPGTDAGNEQQKSQEGLEQADGIQSQTLTTKRTYLKGRRQEILAVFEYIESFPSTPGIEQLDEKLRNDLAVVKQVINWRQQATNDYNYREQFQFYLEQLQMLPDDVKDISFASLDDKTRKKLSKGQSAAKPKTKVKQTRKDDVMPTKKEDAGKTSDTMPSAGGSNMPSHTAEGDGMVKPQKDNDIEQDTVVTQEATTVIEPTTSSEEEASSYLDDEPEPWEMNYAEINDYLCKAAANDPSGLERIKDANELIVKFCHLDNFREKFSELQTMIESGTVIYPGGFAAKKIKEMLDQANGRAIDNRE